MDLRQPGGTLRMDEVARVSFEILKGLRRIIRRISEHSRHLSKQVGLTVPQLLCLKAIGEFDADEVTVAMVASEVQLSRPTVSRIIDRLEKSGLVLRERRSKTDRRRVCLSLTEKGERSFAALPTPLQEVFLQRLRLLPAGEISELMESLSKILRLMDAEAIEAAPLLTPEPDLRDQA